MWLEITPWPMASIFVPCGEGISQLIQSFAESSISRGRSPAALARCHPRCWVACFRRAPSATAWLTPCSGLPTFWINGFRQYISGALGEYDAFGQGTWKVSRNLTLTFGLRYEYNGLTT